MARYTGRHNFLLAEEIEILRDEYRRDVFDGAQAPTRIRAFALSGTINEFTEEVSYYETYSWANVSGIIHSVAENDDLLGANGRVKVGDTSVIYHYNSISGVFLQNNINEIELLVPGITGVYSVTGYKVGELAGAPMYVKFALAADKIAESRIVQIAPSGGGDGGDGGGEPSLDDQIAALFSSGEQGAWYDPSANNTTWRRNLLRYTEQFDNTVWTGSTRVTANQTVAPDGLTTADHFRESNTATAQEIYQEPFGSGAVPPYVTLTFSVYAKAAERTRIGLAIRNNTRPYTIFELVGAGAKLVEVAGQTATIEAVGNGWYRCSVTKTLSSPAAYDGMPYIAIVNNTNNTNYQGDNVSGVYLWGAQFERGTTLTTYQPILTPEIAYLSTVQAQPLLFQAYTGGAVTEVEQPVGLMLDKRKGLALEAALNVDFTSGWSVVAGGTVTDSNTFTCTSVGGITKSMLTIGKAYKLTVSYVKTGSSSQFTINNHTGSTTNTIYTATETSGSATITFYATNASLYLRCDTADTIDVTWSIQAIEGNHAYQTTTSARPHLRSRYNLLTYSEQFDNAIWLRTGVQSFGGGSIANAATAPDGTTTADKVVEDGNSSQHSIIQNVAVTAGVSYVFSVYAKAAERKRFTIRYGSISPADNSTFDLSGTGSVVAGAGEIVPVGNGWYRCSLASTPASTGTRAHQLYLNTDNSSGTETYQGDGTSGIYIWGAQLNLGTAPLSYQRIAATPTLSQPPTYATVSTMGGEVFRPYLDADGSDDWMQVAGCNLGNAWTHVGGWLCETTGRRAFATTDTFNDALRADGSASFLGYMGWYNTSGVLENLATGTMLNTCVVAVTKTSLTSMTGRYNGGGSLTMTPRDDSASPRGLALFNQTITVPASYWDGRLFGGIWIARALSSSEVSTAEEYLAGKTGVTL